MQCHLEDRGRNPMGTASHRTDTHNTILDNRLGNTLPYFRISGSCIAPQNPFSQWQKCIAELVLWSRPHTYGKGTARVSHVFTLCTTAGYIMLGIDGNYTTTCTLYKYHYIFNSKYFCRSCRLYLTCDKWHSENNYQRNGSDVLGNGHGQDICSVIN